MKPAEDERKLQTNDITVSTEKSGPFLLQKKLVYLCHTFSDILNITKQEHVFREKEIGCMAILVILFIIFVYFPLGVIFSLTKNYGGGSKKRSKRKRGF